jgi:hypothetical protein
MSKDLDTIPKFGINAAVPSPLSPDERKSIPRNFCQIILVVRLNKLRTINIQPLNWYIFFFFYQFINN